MQNQRPSGEYLWMAGELRIDIVENTVDLADLDPVVRAVQPEFGVVEIRRQVAGPAAGGPGIPEAALAIVFVAVAKGFFEELGKDLYAEFRSALRTAYRRAKTWANLRGYTPMTASRYDLPNVIFDYPPGMTDETFEGALKSFFNYEDEEVARLDGEITQSGSPGWIVLRFDAETKAWRIEKKVP